MGTGSQIETCRIYVSPNNTHILELMNRGSNIPGQQVIHILDVDDAAAADNVISVMKSMTLMMEADSVAHVHCSMFEPWLPNR